MLPLVVPTSTMEPVTSRTDVSFQKWSQHHKTKHNVEQNSIGLMQFRDSHCGELIFLTKCIVAVRHRGYSLRHKSVCLVLQLGGHTDHMSSLHHITEPQSRLTFLCVERSDSCLKTHQGWADFHHLCHLDLFSNHTVVARRHLTLSHCRY